jgi:hypothetical protein
MLRRGFIEETILATLLNKDNRISDHVYDQPDPQGYAERQIAEAKQRIDLQGDEDGKVLKTAANICVALVKMKVTLRYDRFADQMLVTGLKGFGPVMEDAAVNRIWLLLKRHFDLHVSKDMLFTVVVDIAYTNGFHPVCDYLEANQPTWDGIKRVEGNDGAAERDLTGNRRFLPTLCGKVDLDALRRDVHQLWAEAATLEASGMSIRLAEELWPVAAEEQNKRLPPDEWYTLLKEAFEECGLKPKQDYKISVTSVWIILNVPEHLREHNASLRVGKAMRSLGWERPNRQGRIKVNGEVLSGFVKGESPWTNVTATRDLGHLIVKVGGITEQDPDEDDFRGMDGLGDTD